MIARTRLALSFALLLGLLAMAPGCLTSEGYKDAVYGTYPRIADRLEKYPLTDSEAVDVARLRTVSANRNAVTYDAAKPAWDASAPTYREKIATDESLSAPLKREYLYTADGIDRLQRAEELYRDTLGLVRPQP